MALVATSSGSLSLPADGVAPYPVAVLIHGGFWRARYSRRLGWRSRGGWPATLEDVAAGIHHLGTLEEPFDLARVVAIGHSAGGHLAFWAATGGACRRMRPAPGPESGRRPQWPRGASPIERLPLGVPVLLVHGESDDVVPISIARGFYERVHEAGDRCELMALPDVGHMEHLDARWNAWRVVADRLERI